MRFSRIAGTGAYLPVKVVTNHELAQTLDTSDQWIFSRTGIRERRVAADDELASDLALHASRQALDAAGLKATELDLIIVATTTPDMVFPSTACILQKKLGAGACMAFDVQAVCSGFVYGLAIADLFVRAGKCRRALVVGAEIYSRILDWADRSTCVLFGDGAGAVVVTDSDAPGILSTHLHADGNYHDILCVPGHVSGGGIRGKPFVVMDGGTVFKFAVKVLHDVAQEALVANALNIDDIDWLILHQANIRIIEATAKRLRLPLERAILTVERHANTSAASIPLALDEAVRDGRVRRGQCLLLEGVGGGFTWGAVLTRF